MPNAVQGLTVVGDLTLVSNSSSSEPGNVMVPGTVTSGGKSVVSGRRVRGARVPLSDMDHTIHVTDGNRFVLSSAPAAVRTITIDDTTPVPDADETIEIIMPGPAATGQQYLIKRVSGVIIAEFWGNALGDAGASAEFEYVDGFWRLGFNGGGGAAGGVLSGAGA